MKSKRRAIHPVFRRILASYLSMCAVLIGITAIGGIQSILYMRKELRHEEELKLRSIVEEIENNIKQTYQICGALAENSDLEEIAQIKDTFTAEQIRQAVTLKQSLAEGVGSHFVKELYVYFFNSDTILSARSQMLSGEAETELFYSRYGIPQELFLYMVSGEIGKNYQTLENNHIWFFLPVNNDEGNRDAVIIAEYDAKSLSSIQNKDSIVAISDGEDILLCAGSLTEEGQKQLVSGRNEITVSGKRYLLVQQQMDLFQWTCFAGTSQEMLWYESKNFMRQMLLEAVVLLVMTLVGSWYFSRRAFIPVGNLMRDNKTLHSRLDKNEKALAAVEFSRYLNGESKEPAVSHETFSDLFFLKDTDTWRMAVLSVQHGSKEGLASCIRQEDRQEVLQKLLFDHYPGSSIPMGKYDVAIFGCSRQEEQEDQVKACLQEIVHFYKEELDSPLLVMLGQPEIGYTVMPAVYQALLEGLQYLDFWQAEEEMQGVYVYGKFMDIEEQVSYSSYIDETRKLLNCLAIEDFPGAYQELDRILRETFPRNKRYLKYNIYLMYGLIGIMLTSLDTYGSQKDREFIESLHYEERLFCIQSIRTLQEESCKIFEAIIAYRESQVKEGEPVWMADVRQYIEDHYAQPDLNVSALAEHFGISVPHLSRTFKKVEGYGVLEYIHMIRLKNAKEMLKNGMNVKNTSLAAGYIDAKSFTRSFKKYEGITPSQYQKGNDTISKT